MAVNLTQLWQLNGNISVSHWHASYQIILAILNTFIDKSNVDISKHILKIEVSSLVHFEYDHNPFVKLNQAKLTKIYCLNSNPTKKTIHNDKGPGMKSKQIAVCEFNAKFTPRWFYLYPLQPAVWRRSFQITSQFTLKTF